ncbi:MAG: hypothetical protein IPN89_14010 [Saprospiraceae bacterium]|nr:hypothetical protein [Saprospiraceae bacterium]
MQIFKFFVFSFLLLSGTSMTAGNSPFPAINVKTLDGKTVNTQDFTGSGKITVVSFWLHGAPPVKENWMQSMRSTANG